jgi:uncharacterized sulfatase
MITGNVVGADRPNVLWISCEDISPHLGCYGDPQATTPNLDQLAADGILYTHAFSCHGVCAPSRTGIITAMTPIALGANHMRSKVRLPDHVQLFPQLLREAGYYCTNNSKTDYNLDWNQKATWDMSSGKAHWKNRPSADTPFFAVFNLTMTHESKVWPKGWEDVVRELPPNQRHRADAADVPPLYPDTPAVRGDFARLADLITVMDLQVGQLLQELDEAGEADNTIVMFWSDHGNGLPRAKRWTYDSGSRVPLIVRVPEKLRSVAGGGEPGHRDDRMINLIDLGPTVLSLAGIPLPAHLHGVPFLGAAKGEERQFIHGARDRLDERFDLVRTVRSRTHRYVRNLMPWRPALQHVAYGEQNETLREMRRLANVDQLAPQSSQWFQSPRAAEELYDLASDPWELVNLANRPEHQATLKLLSEECDRWQIEVRDAHLLPEIMLDEAEAGGGNRWQVLHGADGEQRTHRLLQTAKLVSHLSEQSANELDAELDLDPAVRWWQLTLLSRAANPDRRLEVLRREATNANPALAIAAAAGLSRAGQAEEAAAVLKRVLNSRNPFVRHAAFLEIDEAGPELIQMLRDQLSVSKDEEYLRRLSEHALGQL